MEIDLTQAGKMAASKADQYAAALSSQMLPYALQYAEEGYRVFPLQPKNKIPFADTNGCLDATTDPDRIREWWTKWPDANIGIATGRGLAVLDVDPAKGGSESVESMTIPNTLTVITGSGGLHFYFRTDKTVRNSASKMGKGIDVRGEGGYVVAPPSAHPSGGAYSWVDLTTPKADWPFPVEVDQPRAEPRGDAESVPEGMRNDYLFRYAASLRRHGATQEEIEEAVLRRNEIACDPPLPEAEALNAARSGSKYDPEPMPEQPEIMARNAEEFLAIDVPSPKWLVENVWPEQAIGFVAGPPKSFKSFYVLEMAFAAATGKPFMGKFHVPEPRTILLVQAESALGAFKDRVRAATTVYGPATNLYIISNRPLSLEDEESLDRLEMEIRSLNPALVILDPLASFIESDENSTQAMGGVVRTLRKMRDEFNCGFCIVHHSRKTDASTTRGGDGMRGSSALYAACEAAAWIRRVGDEVPRSHIKFELKDGEGPQPMTLQFTDNGLRVVSNGELLGEALKTFKNSWSDE